VNLMMYAVFLIVIAMVTVTDGKYANATDMGVGEEMGTIEDADVEALAKAKIYFGHASVGYNVMDGIEAIIKDDVRFKAISIKKLDGIDVLDDPGIYHGSNPKNGFPKTYCIF